VPLYIICVRLGPSIPGVYVNPGFWTPKIRVLQRAKRYLDLILRDHQETNDSYISPHPSPY
jgi:hypothetical protein